MNLSHINDGSVSLIDGVWHRKCRVCSEIKPHGDFYKNQSGLSTKRICRKCDCANAKIRDAKRRRLRAVSVDSCGLDYSFLSAKW